MRPALLAARAKPNAKKKAFVSTTKLGTTDEIPG